MRQQSRHSSPRTAAAWPAMLVLAILLSPAQSEELPADPPFPHIGPPITELERDRFCDSLAAYVRNNQPDSIDGLIDWDITIAKCSSTIAFPVPNAKAKFETAVRKTIKSEHGVARLLCFKERADHAFLRIRNRRESDQRVVFRRFIPGQSPEYFEFYLVRRPDGSVRCVDVRMCSSIALWNSDCITQFVPEVLPPTGLLERWLGDDADQQKLAAAGKLIQLMSDGKYAECVATYRELPIKIRNDRLLAATALNASSLSTLEDYGLMIRAYEELFGKDTCLVGHQVDYLYLTAAWRESLRAIDELDQFVGGDPYLDVLRADRFLMANDLDAARERAIRARDLKYTGASPYWTLAAIALKSKDFPETIRLLKLLAKDFGMDIHSDDPNNDAQWFVGLPEFGPFTESQSYAEWQKLRK